jgi:hypothetical protein
MSSAHNDTQKEQYRKMKIHFAIAVLGLAMMKGVTIATMVLRDSVPDSVIATHSLRAQFTTYCDPVSKLPPDPGTEICIANQIRKHEASKVMSSNTTDVLRLLFGTVFLVGAYRGMGNLVRARYHKPDAPS